MNVKKPILWLIMALLSSFLCGLLASNFKYAVHHGVPVCKIPAKEDTPLYMRHMADVIKNAMHAHGQTNVSAYLNSLAKTRKIPREIDERMMKRIFKESGLYPMDIPRSYHVLGDDNGKSIMMTLTTNHNGEVGIKMHSFGPNGIDENGQGDDILMWFDANTFFTGHGNGLLHEK